MKNTSTKYKAEYNNNTRGRCLAASTIFVLLKSGRSFSRNIPYFGDDIWIFEWTNVFIGLSGFVWVTSVYSRVSIMILWIGILEPYIQLYALVNRNVKIEDNIIPSPPRCLDCSLCSVSNNISDYHSLKSSFSHWQWTTLANPRLVSLQAVHIQTVTIPPIDKKPVLPATVYQILALCSNVVARNVSHI